MGDLIQQGVAAFRAGQRDEARKLFIAAVKQFSDSERAWGWLYNVANNDEERIHCLKQITKINPKNEKANDLLNDLLGFQPPLEKPTPAGYQRPFSNSAPNAQPRPFPTNLPIPQSLPVPWYRSTLAYVLFFFFLTPVWAILILTDKRQSNTVRIIVGVIGFGYLFFVCGLSMMAVFSPNTSSPYTSIITSIPTQSLPTRTPLPTVDPEIEKAQWKTVDIRALVKNPDAYIGSEVHYKGEVFNIEEDSDGAYMQVWIGIPGGNEFDREAIYVYWSGTSENIYEGTTIEVWGICFGSIEGTNAFGATIRQPFIQAAYITYFH